jgi:ketosteroid isomerase-like protein
MARTTQQVFDAHREAFEPINLEKLMADYADDAILLTLDDAFVGKEAIQGFFENIFESFPNLKVSFEKTAVEGDIFLLQWSGESDVATFPHGTAAFIIRDGKIQRQAEWFIVVPKEA